MKDRLDQKQLHHMIGILVLLVYIPMIIAAFTYAKRRLNDLDKSGWLSLLFLVPLVNIIITLYIMFWRGTQGTNRFGPQPNKNPVGALILAWIFPVIAILGIVAAIALPAYQQYIERAAGG